MMAETEPSASVSRTGLCAGAADRMSETGHPVPRQPRRLAPDTIATGLTPVIAASSMISTAGSRQPTHERTRQPHRPRATHNELSGAAHGPALALASPTIRRFTVASEVARRDHLPVVDPGPVPPGSAGRQEECSLTWFTGRRQRRRPQRCRWRAGPGCLGPVLWWSSHTSSWFADPHGWRPPGRRVAVPRHQARQ
jgi:hypothetical protein